MAFFIERADVFLTFASSACLLITACGGATSPNAPDAGSKGTENDASSDARWDGNASSDARSEGNAPMPCTGGPVTFAMQAADGNASNYCIGRACFLDWLDVTNERGEAVPYALGCRLSCVDCISGGCDPICINPRPLKQEGERLVWDGSVWSSSSSCGGGRSCTSPTCAAPGRYVAKMCATALAPSDAGVCVNAMKTPQSCVEVEFEYPTAAPVVGVLPR